MAASKLCSGSSTPSDEDDMHTKFLQLGPEIVDYLQSIKISPDDPALVFAWIHREMERFVWAANNVVNLPARPPWLGGMALIDADSLESAIVAFLATSANGHLANVVVAPCNVQQYGVVLHKLVVDVQENDWFQTVARAMIAPQQP